MHPMRPDGMNVPPIAMNVAQKVAGVSCVTMPKRGLVATWLTPAISSPA